MNIAQKYVDGLKRVYYKNSGQEQWDTFETIKYGAGKKNIITLQALYPDIPDSLL